MQDNEIDLNLARNYIPACMTVVKTICLLIVLEFLDSFHIENGVIGVIMILFVDRIYTKIVIFDGNVILLFITLSYLSHWMVQRSVMHWDDRIEILWYIFSVIWILFSLYIQAIYGCISMINLRIYFIVTGFFVTLVPFSIHGYKEVYTWRVIRGMVFCVMCLFWIYVVGIYKHRMTKPMDSGIHFVVYFSPCLFVSFYPAIAFCFFVLCVVMWSSSNSNNSSLSINVSNDIENVNSLPNKTDSKPASTDHEMEELQQLLRQAKELKARQ